MKILGFDADNPFSLFLILILLLASSGAFDSKAAQAEDTQEAGAPDDKKEAKRPTWQTRPNHPLFQRRKVSWSSPARTPRLRRLRTRRDLAVSLPKIMPLGR